MQRPPFAQRHRFGDQRHRHRGSQKLDRQARGDGDILPKQDKGEEVGDEVRHGKEDRSRHRAPWSPEPFSQIEADPRAVGLRHLDFNAQSSHQGELSSDMLTDTGDVPFVCGHALFHSHAIVSPPLTDSV